MSSPTLSHARAPADGPRLRLVTGSPVKAGRNALAKLGVGRWTAGPVAKRPTRVLIVDAAAPFRGLARELLERRGYVVVGEAASAASALAEAARVRPDAVLLDVHLPDGSGLDVCTALCSALPAPAVLLVAMYDLPGRDRQVEACGASGFALKTELASADFARFWPDARPGIITIG